MAVKKILVTGASGFLGCRLVERLLYGEKVEVRAMAHRPGSASRLARLPVEIVWCDITDYKQAYAAVSGCDAVVHCAYGGAGTPGDNKKSTVDGTRIMARAAADAGVKCFVHISTIAVYSYLPQPGINENSPMARRGDAYCMNKTAAENIIRAAVRDDNLPAVILRMGNIYGPFSGPWTIRPLKDISAGSVSMVDDGANPSNMVFVDNAVESILLALNNESVAGEALFITDDEISWKDFYGEYASWLSDASLKSISGTELNALLKPSLASRWCSFWRDIWDAFIVPVFRYAAFKAVESKSMVRLVIALSRPLPERVRVKILGGCGTSEAAVELHTVTEDTALPPLGLLEVYSGKVGFSNASAKQKLGYRPLVSHEDAMKITRDWAEWARILQ